MDCLHLVELFGDKYRTGFDPAYDPRHRPQKSRDPWMMTIPCSRGVILPFGGEYLIAEVEDRPRIANRLAQLSCVELLQDGDRFIAVKFHVRDFEQVAQLLRPRKKPRLTAERRAALAERMRKLRAEGKPRADEEPRAEEKRADFDPEVNCHPELSTRKSARAKSPSKSQLRLFSDE
jgi:hypothetical protein